MCIRDRYWDVVKDGCGITRKQYDLYYQDQEIAIAYRLGTVYDCLLYTSRCV